MTQGRLKKWLYLRARMRRHLNHATALHFTTMIERDAVSRLGLKAPSFVEPLGIDTREFEQMPPKGSLIEQYPQLKNRLIVLFLGRLHPVKGLDLLIPAF